MLLVSHSLIGQVKDTVLNFDGSNDYVNINSISGLASNLNDFTLEFWMQANANQQATIRVNMFSVNKPASFGDNEFLIIMGGTGTSQDGKLVIYDDRSNPKFVLESDSIIGDGDCHHIAFVRSGDSGEAFIDGISIGKYRSRFVLSSSDRYSLGQDWDKANNSEFYKGDLNEFRLWSTAKSAAEIQNLMNSETSGAESNLETYYDFNQACPNGTNSSVNTLLDRTSNGNHGSLIGFTLNSSVSNWVDEKCSSEQFEIVSQGFCETDTSFFALSGNPAYSVFWNFDDPNSGTDNFDTGLSVKHVFSEAGTYYVRASFNNCTNTEIEYILTIIPRPHSALLDDTTLCEADILILYAPENVNALWSTGSTEDSLIVTNSGDYWLRIDSLGCYRFDSIAVVFENCDSCQDKQDMINSNIVINPSDTVLCYGQSLTLDVPDYTDWEIIWNDGTAGNTIEVDEAGTYYAIYSYGDCIFYSSEIEVDFRECNVCDSIFDEIQASLELGNDQTLCIGETYTISLPSTFDSLRWSNGLTSNKLTIDSNLTLYAYVYIDTCEYITTSISLEFINCNTCHIYFPNAFSPNDDKLNDIFRPIIPDDCIITISAFEIYNRWGEKLYESDIAAWDGFYKDEAVQQDVYFFIAKYQQAGRDTQTTYKGLIHLLR